MKDIYSEIVRLLNSKTPAALATIIQVRGSSPRGMGSKYLVPKGGPTIGSVGGGCLEAKVWQAAMDSIERGKNALMKFKLDDEEMADSGLICGGTVTILIEPLQTDEETLLPIYQRIERMRERGERGILASVVSTREAATRSQGSKVLFETGEEQLGVLSEGKALENQLMDWCLENTLKELEVKSLNEKDGQQIEVLLEPIQADPTLYVFGAGHIAQALSPMAKMVDFRVVILDDRPNFANRARFPEADEVLVEPFEMVFEKLKVNSQSYVVIVTRGHLYDGEVLEQALKTEAGYIGMIGSKRKIAILYKGLMNDGIKKEVLNRVYAPIGLDIHSETPEEIAVSILAQLVKVRAENNKGR